MDVFQFTTDNIQTERGMQELNRLIKTIGYNMAGDGEGQRIFSGYGTPEGVVSATTGSIYMNKDSTSGSAQYIKETATGTTGWKAVGSGTGDFVPTGVMFPYGKTTAPTGYLLCDGSAVSRTTYSALFAIIGESFGAGDASTTFNVPSIKGKTVVGYDSGDGDYDAMGHTGGAKTHDHTVTVSGGDHAHPLPAENRTGTSSGGTTAFAMGNTTSSASHTHTASSNTVDHKTPYIAIPWIIKT